MDLEVGDPRNGERRIGQEADRARGQALPDVGGMDPVADLEAIGRDSPVQAGTADDPRVEEHAEHDVAAARPGRR